MPGADPRQPIDPRATSKSRQSDNSLENAPTSGLHNFGNEQNLSYGIDIGPVEFEDPIQEATSRFGVKLTPEQEEEAKVVDKVVVPTQTDDQLDPISEEKTANLGSDKYLVDQTTKARVTHYLKNGELYVVVDSPDPLVIQDFANIIAYKYRFRVNMPNAGMGMSTTEVVDETSDIPSLFQEETDKIIFRSINKLINSHV